MSRPTYRPVRGPVGRPSAGGRRPAPRRPGGARATDEPAPSSARRVAGVVLLASAVLTLFRPILLSLWFPELDADPSVLTAVVLQALLGAALLQGSDGARKFAIGVMVVGVLALFGVGTLLVLGSVRAWLVVAGFALLWSAGMLTLLMGEEPPAARVRAGIAIVIVGWVGSLASEVWFLRLPDLRLWDRLEETAFPHRVVDDSAEGIVLKLPECWFEVPHDPELIAGEPPRHMLACPDSEVLARLDIETSPLAVDDLGDFADLSFRRIRPEDDSLVELSFTEPRLGEVPAMRTAAGWEWNGGRFRAHVLVWRDGWRYAALVAWSREHYAEAAGQAFDALVAGLDVRAPLTERMAEIAEAARELCPHLTPQAVEMVITPVLQSRPDARISPETLFRVAWTRAARGFEALAPNDQGELGRLNQAAFGTMSAGERRRLGVWLERVRAGQPTQPAQDRSGAASMARAFRKLPQRSQERFRALTQNAIALGGR